MFEDDPPHTEDLALEPEVVAHGVETGNAVEDDDDFESPGSGTPDSDEVILCSDEEDQSTNSEDEEDMEIEDTDGDPLPTDWESLADGWEVADWADLGGGAHGRRTNARSPRMTTGARLIASKRP